jgi:transposase
VLFARIGPWRRQEFSTQIVDVNAGQLLDVVPGRSGDKPKEWLEAKGKEWRDNVSWATLDLSGPYRAVFDEKLPGATQVADPFHVVKLANTKLDECRRRVQNETMGHRGRKSDPSIAAGVSSPRPTSASMRKGRRSSSGSCGLAIPEAT